MNPLYFHVKFMVPDELSLTIVRGKVVLAYYFGFGKGPILPIDAIQSIYSKNEILLIAGGQSCDNC